LHGKFAIYAVAEFQASIRLSLLPLLVAEASSRSWRQLTDYLYNQDSKKKPQNSKVANSFFAPTWKAPGHI
jgi:hypothetical protein